MCSRLLPMLQWNTDQKGRDSSGVYVLIIVYGGGKSGQDLEAGAEARHADWLVSLYNPGWSPA